MIYGLNRQFGSSAGTNCALQNRHYGFGEVQRMGETDLFMNPYDRGEYPHEEQAVHTGSRSILPHGGNPNGLCRYEEYPYSDDGKGEEILNRSYYPCLNSDRGIENLDRSSVRIREQQNIFSNPSKHCSEVIYRGEDVLYQSSNQNIKTCDVSNLYRGSFIGNCDTVSRVSTVRFEECRFSSAGRHHLPEIQRQTEPRLGLKLIEGKQGKQKKKRYRPFAAARERDRLVVMNSALGKLKSSLPLNDCDQKVSKKEILQTAILYIKFLNSILQNNESTEYERKYKTLNLNEHNYLYS